MIKREVQPKRYIQYLELSRTYPSLQLHFRGAFVRIEMSKYSEVAKAVESKAIFIGPDAQAFLQSRAPPLPCQGTMKRNT